MDYFQKCSCLETNPCVLFFTISLTLEEAVTTAKFGTRKSTFQILQFGTDKTSMNGVYKTNIDCSFIQGMLENHCTLGKIQLWPTFTSALRALDNNFPSFRHEQSIFVYHILAQPFLPYRFCDRKIFSFP